MIIEHALSITPQQIQQPQLILAKLDTDCRYTAVTEYSVQLCGFRSVEAMQGCTAFDFNCPTASNAAMYYAQDKQVINTAQPMRIFSINHYADDTLLCLLTTKKPIINPANGEVIGVEAFCQPIATAMRSPVCQALYRNAQYLLGQKRFVSTTFEIVDRYHQLDLTPHESQVVFLLMLGKTAKAISQLLQRSPRTIETHINHIKAKLGLHNKNQIVEYSTFCGLSQLIPATLLD